MLECVFLQKDLQKVFNAARKLDIKHFILKTCKTVIRKLSIYENDKNT